jgi:hypothetical protein
MIVPTKTWQLQVSLDLRQGSDVVLASGLISYGPSFADRYRRSTG